MFKEGNTSSPKMVLISLCFQLTHKTQWAGSELIKGENNVCAVSLMLH